MVGANTNVSRAILVRTATQGPITGGFTREGLCGRWVIMFTVDLNNEKADVIKLAKNPRAVGRATLTKPST